MTQANVQKAPNPSKTSPSGSPKTEATPTQASSGGDDRAYRAQVAAEIAQLRNQVNQSLQGGVAGVNAIANEYEAAAQPLAEEASHLIYDMLSNRSFFHQVGQNVGQLMSRHPMGEKQGLIAPTLKRLSFKPLPQATQQSYLNGVTAETEG